MATPPSRSSTPSGSSHTARTGSKALRSASYAPTPSASSVVPSSARNGAGAGAGADEFLSPVSRFNRSLDHARQEQAVRMKTIEGERAHRLATKQTTAKLFSGGSGVASSSVKRKLTELEAAAQAAQTQNQPMNPSSRWSEPVKKIRTVSPTHRPNKATERTASASASRRGVSHGVDHTVSTTTSAPMRSAIQNSLSASALKRHDDRHTKSEFNDRVSAANAPDAQDRYLAYEQPPPARMEHTTPPRSHRSSVAEAHSLFSRHNDPSILKTPPDSTSSSPFKFPDYESSVSSTRGSPSSVLLRTPPSRQEMQRQLSSPFVPPRGEDGMVDLDHVSTVSQLETLEGDDILSMMMAQSTPRVDRHFPSEHARTDSEDREIQFLRRRRLAGSSARKSLDPNTPVVTNRMVKAKWSFDSVLAPVASPSTGAVRRGVVSKEAQQARDDAENAKADAAENDTLLDDDDDDDDCETTEFKVEQFSRAKRWGLKRFLFWVVVGASLICIVDVAVPLLASLFQPPLPYCDNRTVQDATALAVVNGGDQSEFTALEAYRADCRACPQFGICTNGSLVSCLPPLEQQRGACVESKEVQHALEQIAKSIEMFVTDKATRQVCGPAPLPTLFGDDQETIPTQWSVRAFSAAHVVVLLSELKEIVLKSPFAETMMHISLAASAGNTAAAEYVVNRSLHLALSSFQKITQISFHSLTQFGNQKQESGDMLIQFSTSVAPWSCRARNQLLTHAYLIAIAVALFAIAMLLYRRWLVYKTKRALVDRLVKEVRYFLLGRSHRTERFYPANHLRDNLFDTLPGVSLRDRKWLRESVWPTVATIINEDSRVHSRIAPIHGKQMVVWEWISSNSPNMKVTEKKSARVRNPRKRYSI